jgi:nicotinamide mononucleotide (NMN) deamidase PncC
MQITMNLPLIAVGISRRLVTFENVSVSGEYLASSGGSKGATSYKDVGTFWFGNRFRNRVEVEQVEN